MVRFETASGAVYALDLERKRWSRLAGRDGNALRSASGEYNYLEGGLNVGECAVLVCPPFEPGNLLRIIHTTPVKRIWADSGWSVSSD